MVQYEHKPCDKPNTGVMGAKVSFSQDFAKMKQTLYSSACSHFQKVERVNIGIEPFLVSQDEMIQADYRVT